MDIHLIRQILTNKLASLTIFGSRFCCVCNKNVGRFLSYEGGWESVPPLARSLDAIGSDPDHFSCPRCGSHDRERHLVLYLTALNLFEEMRDAAILHFAPERWLSGLIAAQHPSKYVRADLFPSAPDIEKIDMLDIPSADNSFDWVIANHVLEHVPDEMIAIAEIWRVLRPGGYALLQTPYCNGLKHTFCDEGISQPEARLQAYGQKDHVRLFGQDIFKKITSSGMTSCVADHLQLLPYIDADYYGVNVKEPLMLFRKV